MATFFLCHKLMYFKVSKFIKMNTFSFGPAMIIGVIFMVIGMIVSSVLKRKFIKYSKIPSQRGFTGKEIAEKMLNDYGVHDVRVISVQGQLTDHYNPGNKTVNLSTDVYNGRNAAAAAIAAHECGHAIQHATNYAPLTWRSKLVPLQAASAQIIQIIMLATVLLGAFIFETFPINAVLIVICTAYGFMALFSIVTLPVEFDASKRALKWIEDSGISTAQEYEYSKDALKWAALTYVVAALGAIATVAYYLTLLFGNRNQN